MHMCKKCITFNVLKIKLIQTFSMRKVNKKSSNINGQLELFEAHPEFGVMIYNC